MSNWRCRGQTPSRKGGDSKGTPNLVNMLFTSVLGMMITSWLGWPICFGKWTSYVDGNFLEWKCHIVFLHLPFGTHPRSSTVFSFFQYNSGIKLQTWNTITVFLNTLTKRKSWKVLYKTVPTYKIKIIYSNLMSPGLRYSRGSATL